MSPKVLGVGITDRGAFGHYLATDRGAFGHYHRPRCGRPPSTTEERSADIVDRRTIGWLTLR